MQDVSDDDLNAIVQAGERAPKFTSKKEQILYAEANPLYDKYLDAQKEAEDLLDELVQDSIRAQDKFYDAALDDFRKNDLATVDRTAEVVRFILNPPFNGAGAFFYKVISNAAIATLDQHELTLLGLEKRSKIWLKISRVSLDLFLAILGPEAPAVAVARERIAKSS
jgi:hypothetical protein